MHMQKLKKLLIFAFTVSLFFPIASTTYGKTDSEWAILLSEKLNELKFFDLSEDALKQEIKKNPEDVDLLKIQLAITKFASNKSDEANTIVSSIPSTSQYYPNSRRVLGIEAWKKQKFDIAAAILEEYFKVSLAKPPTSELGKKEYLEAVSYLVEAYKRMGKVEEANKSLKYRDSLNKESANAKEGSNNGLGDRDTMLQQVIINMDIAEEMLARKKEGADVLINDSFKVIEKIQWGGQDILTVLTYFEKARGLCALGRLDDALKEIQGKVREDVIAAFDEEYKRQNSIFMAPSVYKLYWLGKIYNAKGRLATDENEKTKFYSEGIKNLFAILKNKDYDQFPKWDDTLSAFLEAKDQLEKLNHPIVIPANMKDRFNPRKTTIVSSFDKKEADQYFTDGKFENATTSYAKAFHNLSNRKSLEAGIILARLASSYLKSDHTLEAMAIALDLGDEYKNSENTPLIMAQVGGFLWEAAKAKKDPKNKDRDDKQAEALFSDAMLVYTFYLKIFPADQYAGDISYTIAKFKLKNAEDMAVYANTLPQGTIEKAKKAAEAREAFKNAAPYFQNILDNFAQTRWGIISAYLLPWCYTNSLDFLTGAEKFKNYCDMAMAQEGEKDIGNLADAKMRISDNYIQYAKALEKEAENPSGNPQEQVSPPEANDSKPEKADVKTEEPGTDEKVEKPEPKKPEKKSPSECYKLALDNLLEMLNKWCAAGGILENTKNEKALKAIEYAYMLLGWAYDGSGGKENACKAFDTFIKKYPQSNTAPLAMFRMGLIYGDLKKFDDAGKVLETLAEKYPNTQEGKLALPTLGRNMYEIKNYDKSISVFTKILTQNIEVSVQDLRWACANLWDCGGKHPKEGGDVAMKAGEKLLTMIAKPAMEDWIGVKKLKETADNPDDQKKLMGAIRDKITFDYSSACYWAGQYDKALKAADELLANENSPYFHDGRFLRAMTYRAMKKYDKAIADYGDISMKALQTKKYPIYSKAQCLMGDTYIDMGDYMKAYGSLSITATSIPDDLKNESGKSTPEELQDQLEWLGFSIYKSAYVLAKMGRSDEKVKMVEKYKKYYPKGKYAKEIDTLPSPEPKKPDEPAKNTPPPVQPEKKQ